MSARSNLRPGEPGGTLLGLAIPYRAYSLVYTAKIALTLAAMALVLPGYRQFPRPPGLLALLVGGVGVLVWVGLWHLSNRLGLTQLLDHLPGYGQRPEFNPLEQLAADQGYTVPAAWAFLAIRFFGLVLVVPVIEEFFLRGFLMRLVVDEDWWKVPFGKVNAAAVAVSIVVPVLMASARRIPGRGGLVRHGHLVDGSHPQSLGLRAGPRGDESVVGHLRGLLAAVGILVGSGRTYSIHRASRWHSSDNCRFSTSTATCMRSNKACTKVCRLRRSSR